MLIIVEANVVNPSFNLINQNILFVDSHDFWLARYSDVLKKLQPSNKRRLEVIRPPAIYFNEFIINSVRKIGISQ